MGCTATLAGGEVGETAPEATDGLVTPIPTRYIIKYSPGLAGFPLVTREKLAECCAMMCAPFWSNMVIVGAAD